MYEKKETDGVNAKFDWDRSFFEQCQRIDSSLSIGEMKKNIDLLECKLSPYIDKEFKTDKMKFLTDFIKEAKMFPESGVPKEIMLGMEWNIVRATYSALYKLAYRQKILPQRTIPEKGIGEEMTKGDNNGRLHG